MEVYAAMVDRMDQGIGRIVGRAARARAARQHAHPLPPGQRRLRRGHGPQAECRRPRRDATPAAARAGRSPARHHAAKQTRDGCPVRMGPASCPARRTPTSAYGKGWANVCNTPFREYKHWVHEGGISTPLIAHWPAGIPPRARQIWSHSRATSSTSWRPAWTLAGATYPAEFNGQPITPAGRPQPGARPSRASRSSATALFWEHEGNRAVRVGKWKLVAKGPKARGNSTDLAADRTEMNDLAGSSRTA